MLKSNRTKNGYKNKLEKNEKIKDESKMLLLQAENKAQALLLEIDESAVNLKLIGLSKHFEDKLHLK